MLIVAPSGRTKLETSSDTPRFFSEHSIVTGRVALLDEVEKANPYVLNLFLQVFDEGFLTDGRGKRVYFSDAVIIMTSNLGSDEFKRYLKPLGFLGDQEGVRSVKRAVVREVENVFSPEFLNRIDDIIVFSPLTFDEVRAITALYLEGIAGQMKEHEKTLAVTDEAIEHLASEGFSVKYGARFLKRRIDERIKIPLTLRWKEQDHFLVDYEGGELVIR